MSDYWVSGKFDSINPSVKILLIAILEHEEQIVTYTVRCRFCPRCVLVVDELRLQLGMNPTCTSVVEMCALRNLGNCLPIICLVTCCNDII